jgi:molybdate transport system substrate-binding protein
MMHASLEAQSIRVAVASSLMPAMKEIKLLFEHQNEITIDLIPGASGTISHQMINGAPFDIFISANAEFALMLHQEKITTQPTQWINGQLILWSRDSISASKSSTTEQAIELYLTNSKLIAMAQPETTPYGSVTVQYLTSIGLKQSIEKKVIYGNNISMTNQYIYAQSADAVFTSLSSQKTLSNKTSGYWIKIESENNSLGHHIVQSLLSNHPENEKFISFLFTPNVLNIMDSFGYTNP